MNKLHGCSGIVNVSEGPIPLDTYVTKEEKSMIAPIPYEKRAEWITGKLVLLNMNFMKKTSSYEEVTVSIDINEENVRKISNWELVVRAIAEGEWSIEIHEISTGRDFSITAYKEG